MDEASLEKSLLKMEREVLALKTVCQRGLGSTLFYANEITYNFTRDYHSFKVYIANGEPMPAIIETFITSPTPIEGASILFTPQSYGASVMVSIGMGLTGNVKIKFVSSSFIERVEA